MRDPEDLDGECTGSGQVCFYSCTPRRWVLRQEAQDNSGSYASWRQVMGCIHDDLGDGSVVGDFAAEDWQGAEEALHSDRRRHRRAGYFC